MTDSDLLRAVSLLGLRAEDLQAFREGPEALSHLKAKAKRGYKAAAMRLHPDRTGGDAEKAEDFKLVSQFVRELEQAVPVKPKPKKRRMSVSFKVTVRVPATHA